MHLMYLSQTSPFVLVLKNFVLVFRIMWTGTVLPRMASIMAKCSRLSCVWNNV